MSVALPHLVPRLVRHLALVVAVPAILAACEPSWKGGAPVAMRPGAEAQRPATVTVYAGDTVFSVARRFNLSVRELIEANNLQPPYQLSPGTVLRLPGAGSGVEHVVQKGDTLLALARRYKVDFNSLAATNNKQAPYVVKLGERLRIPGANTPGVGTQVATAEAAPAGTPGSIIITSPNAPPSMKGRPVGSQPAPMIPLQPPLAQAPEPAPAESAVPPPQNAAFQPTQTLPPPPPSRSGSSFLWPVKGEVVQEFGPLPGKGQHNDGINIAAARGTPVRAAENGVVAYVGNELKGFGNLLLVKHADGWVTAYAHNEHLMVRKGETVKRGQTIATVGASGGVQSPQLHFEIRRGTEAVNPVDLLRDAVASQPAPPAG